MEDHERQAWLLRLSRLDQLREWTDITAWLDEQYDALEQLLLTGTMDADRMRYTIGKMAMLRAVREIPRTAAQMCERLREAR